MTLFRSWSAKNTRITEREGADFVTGDPVFIIVHSDANPASANAMHRLDGNVVLASNGDVFVEWGKLATDTEPVVYDRGIYLSYVGATLTAKAFDTVVPGLGQWLLTLSVWLFAISTMPPD